MQRKNVVKIIFELILFLSVIYLILLLGSPVNRQVFHAKFTLTNNKSGFDLTPGNLSFGMLTPGQTSKRSIKIINDKDYEIFVRIKSRGEISKNLLVEENEFTMKPFSERELSFIVQTTGLNEFREYAGEVIIEAKRNFWWDIFKR